MWLELNKKSCGMNQTLSAKSVICIRLGVTNLVATGSAFAETEALLKVASSSLHEAGIVAVDVIAQMLILKGKLLAAAGAKCI